MSVKARLAAIERRNRPAQLIEIVVAGGLPGTEPFDFARFGEGGSEKIVRQADEGEAEFRSRARAAAKEAGAAHIIFGGLP